MKPLVNFLAAWVGYPVPRILLVTLTLTVVATTASQAQRPAAASEAPLALTGGHLVVSVTVPGGGVADFLLRTGEMSTVLSESFVARHGDGPEVRVGDVALDMSGARTVPDAELRVDGRQYAGTIGGNTVSRYDMLVDVPAGRFALKTPGRRVEWPGVRLSDPVRLRIYHGVAVNLEVLVEGVSHMATIDLGQRELIINAPLAAEVGVSGTGSSTLRLGQIDFPDLPVRVSDHPILERWDPEGAGFVILGTPIVRDCALSMSWLHQELRTCVR